MFNFYAFFFNQLRCSLPWPWKSKKQTCQRIYDPLHHRIFSYQQDVLQPSRYSAPKILPAHANGAQHTHTENKCSNSVHHEGTKPLICLVKCCASTTQYWLENTEHQSKNIKYLIKTYRVVGVMIQFFICILKLRNFCLNQF